MNEELNKKLAEWAGWHEEIATMKGGIRYPVLLSPDESLIEGCEGYIPDHTPNFTESLDACFKWLVPKLHALGLVAVCSFISLTHSSAMIIDAFGRKEDIFMGDKNPAHALCLAIEKMVGNEG